MRFAAGRCGHKALRNLKRITDERYSWHFKSGFRRAYKDIAQGYSGASPAVPPEKYWAAHYRTPKGHEKANQWFEGYQVGAEQAHQSGFVDLNRIGTSAYAGGYQSESVAEPAWNGADGSAFPTYGGAGFDSGFAAHPQDVSRVVPPTAALSQGGNQQMWQGGNQQMWQSGNQQPVPPGAMVW